VPVSSVSPACVLDAPTASSSCEVPHSQLRAIVRNANSFSDGHSGELGRSLKVGGTAGCFSTTMLGHQFAHSAAPVRKVKEVQFGILSPEEIVRLRSLVSQDELTVACRKRTLSQRSSIPRSWTRLPTNQNSAGSWTHAWAQSTEISSVRRVERACQSVQATSATLSSHGLSFIQVRPSPPVPSPACLTHPRLYRQSEKDPRMYMCKLWKIKS